MTARTCHNKPMHWNPKTKECRPYKSLDFKIIPREKTWAPDKRIPFELHSKDGNVQANFFWEPDNVQLRGLYGDANAGGTIHIVYPMANYRGGGLLKDVKEEKILNSLVKRLKEINKYG